MDVKNTTLTLKDYLQKLETFDLITQSKDGFQSEYTFKHIFTQESVYNSLLHTERRQLHQQIGQILEAKAHNIVEKSPLLLAYHFEAAGDTERAVKYLTIGAEQAVVAYANEEARNLYTKALNLIKRDDYRTRWHLLVGREKTLDRLGERGRQADDLTLMQTLAELINDNIFLCKTHNLRASYFDKISEYEASAKAAQVGLRMARQAESPHLEAQSLNLLAQAAWRRFAYADVQRWAHQALAALDYTDAVTDRITCLLHLGRTGYRLGEYDTALAYTRSAQQLTTQADNKDGEAFCHLILGWIYQRLGDYDASAKHYQLKLNIRQAIGDRYGEATALSHLGWVAYDQKNYQAALDCCTQALEISQEVEDRENEAYALSGMGLAMQGQGKLTKAKKFYQQALDIHQIIKSQTLVMFDLSRLAQVALQEQNYEQAYQYSKEVITWINQGHVEQFWDPWLLYYITYQVLQSNQKTKEARQMLKQAYTLLQNRASRISDTYLKECFLNDVEVNQQIATTWQEIKA